MRHSRTMGYYIQGERLYAILLPIDRANKHLVSLFTYRRPLCLDRLANALPPLRRTLRIGNVWRILLARS